MSILRSGEKKKIQLSEKMSELFPLLSVLNSKMIF